MKRKLTLGFSLVELMVAMVLGLLLSGAAISLFITARESYRTNEALARGQETGRYAFEILARSLREAGGIPCGSNLRTANVLNNASSNWWSNWGKGIQGYEGNDNTFPKPFGTDKTNRVSGTDATDATDAPDAVIVWSGTGDSGVTIVVHKPNDAQFEVNTSAHGLERGDIVMACDYRKAAIFQVTNANDSNVTIVHNTGRGDPGNCSKWLGVADSSKCEEAKNLYTLTESSQCQLIVSIEKDKDCEPYIFAGGGTITKITAHAWYVGCNGRGSCKTPAGRSLYRLRWKNEKGSILDEAEEIADGVWDLQLQYLTRDASGKLDTQYRDASEININDWSQVVAVRVELTTGTAENVGTDGKPLKRKWYAVVNLRNRTP